MNLQTTTLPLGPGGDWTGDWTYYPSFPTTVPITFPNTAVYGWWPVTETPRECSGDVHVFPCPHCDKCKCGGAVKAKKGKR